VKRWSLLAVAVLVVVAVGCVPPADGTTQAPPAPTGLKASPGGGSGEVVVTWDPLAAPISVAHYQVFERKLPGQFWLLAVVTDESIGTLEPGRLGIVDAPDFWPWPTIGAPAPRCYVVSAVSTQGFQGAMSPQVCGSPP
jgi:hypothetical protein